MEFFNLIQVNLLAFIILILLYYNIKNNSRTVLFDQKLFLSLVLLTASLLVADIVRAYANGKPGNFMLTLNISAATINYLSAPLSSFIWTLYADYKIYEDKARIKKNIYILSLPILFNSFLILANLNKGSLHGVIFSISENNVYSRGPYFKVVMFITYGYLLYTFIKIIMNKNNIYEKDYASLIGFIIPPFFGGVMQTIFYGVKLTWISLTLSIFIIYINIQDNKLHGCPNWSL